jgi:hypothetical protein
MERHSPGSSGLRRLRSVARDAREALRGGLGKQLPHGSEQQWNVQRLLQQNGDALGHRDWIGIWPRGDNDDRQRPVIIDQEDPGFVHGGGVPGPA